MLKGPWKKGGKGKKIHKKGGLVRRVTRKVRTKRGDGQRRYTEKRNKKKEGKGERGGKSHGERGILPEGQKPGKWVENV